MLNYLCKAEKENKTEDETMDEDETLFESQFPNIEENIGNEDTKTSKPKESPKKEHSKNTNLETGPINKNPILNDNLYYAPVSSSHKSITDALKSIGVDSSFNNRENIAKLNGISHYSGTESQNIELLKLLKKGLLKKGLFTIYSRCFSIR